MWDDLNQPIGQGADRDVVERSIAGTQTSERPPETMLVAASFGDAATVDLLLEHGWSVSAPDRFGVTPLMSAAELGRGAMVAYLVQKGAPVDASDRNGQTALFYSIRSEHPAEAIEALLRAGAESTIVDHAGTSAKDYARQRRLGMRMGNIHLAVTVRGVQSSVARLLDLSGQDPGDRK